MLNKHGGKVRLTFKLEVDQLWIGTKERTQKVAMNTIRQVVSEPIEGHEEYHIVVSHCLFYSVQSLKVEEGLRQFVLGNALEYNYFKCKAQNIIQIS